MSQGKSKLVGNYNYKDKDTNMHNLVQQLLNKSLLMFEYKDLPESIPVEILEYILQTRGYGAFVEFNSKPVIIDGSLTGEQDLYGQPTEFLVSKPKLQKTFKPEEFILIQNDMRKQGLLPIYEKYAYQLIENDITMVQTSINARLMNIITANDSNTKESAEVFLKKVAVGEIGIITDTVLYDSLKVFNLTKDNQQLHDLIEYQQYLKANLYNEIGLNANYNMKKERLISGEIEANADVLYPLIDNMLYCRTQALEKLNQKFKTRATVKLNSSWDYRMDDTVEKPDEKIFTKKSPQKKKKVNPTPTNAMKEANHAN